MFSIWTWRFVNFNMEMTVHQWIILEIWTFAAPTIHHIVFLAVVAATASWFIICNIEREHFRQCTLVCGSPTRGKLCLYNFFCCPKKKNLTALFWSTCMKCLQGLDKDATHSKFEYFYFEGLFNLLSPNWGYAWNCKDYILEILSC